jgi:hypothetical protein
VSAAGAASRGSGGAAAAVAQPVRASSSSSGKGRRAAVLEAPPKLCFELLKERDLKAKLAGLGLSNDGTKKVTKGVICSCDLQLCGQQFGALLVALAPVCTLNLQHALVCSTVLYLKQCLLWQSPLVGLAPCCAQAVC